MFMQALELLQNSGGDVDSIVTDLGVYKLVQLLTVHLPILTASFLLSQEYLGEKIACFPPQNVSDSHSEALNEWCWNQGLWVSEGTRLVQGIYTQPHRFYPLYLPLQAIVFLSPIIIWNILTKSKLLATLRGTQEFLDDLLEVVTQGSGEDVKRRAISLIKQFHATCVHSAESLSLAFICTMRLIYENILLLIAIYFQFKLYNRDSKYYHCEIQSLSSDEAKCTVPILELLDVLWTVNTAALFICLCLNAYLLARTYANHYADYQPFFLNNLPFGDEDDFNEMVAWKSAWTKHSYMILVQIFMENNNIMTKTYVLLALQPEERKRGWKEKLAAKRSNLKRRHLRRMGGGRGGGSGSGAGSPWGSPPNSPGPDDFGGAGQGQGHPLGDGESGNQGDQSPSQGGSVQGKKDLKASGPVDADSGKSVLGGMVVSEESKDSGLETEGAEPAVNVHEGNISSLVSDILQKEKIARFRAELNKMAPDLDVETIEKPNTQKSISVQGRKDLAGSILIKQERNVERGNIKPKIFSQSRLVSKSKSVKSSDTDKINKGKLKVKMSKSALDQIRSDKDVNVDEVKPQYQDYSVLTGVFMVLYVFCILCQMTNIPDSNAIMW